MKIKPDLICLFIIFILLSLGFLFSYGHISSIYSDIGREFYIPWCMNNGDLLYKDIFNVYFPLGYQINALILKLFSNSVCSLLIAGYIASFISLAVVFYITRLYSDNTFSLLTALLVMACCTFYQSISNYIAPYSYSLLYAMTAFLWSLYMLLLFIKNEKFRYYILSCIFMGISFASKYEFSFFILLIFAAGIYKKAGIKQLLFAFFSFAFFPIVSILILMMKGVSVNDLLNSLGYMFKLANTESVKYFYSYAGFVPSFNSFIRNIFSVISGSNSMYFSFMWYIAVIITLYTLYGFFLPKSGKHIEESIIQNKTLMLVLCIAAVVSSIKTAGSVSLELYGTFFLPVLLILITAFVYNISPSKRVRIIYICCLCSLIIFYLYNDTVCVLKNKQNVITTLKNEKIYTNNSYFSQSYNKIINYVSENIKRDESVLVIPEGVMINFITERKSDNNYYYLIPPNVELFTQNSIVKSLKENPPEYIVVFYNTYIWYNKTSFPLGYGKEIQKYIDEYYTVEDSVSSEYDKIYKLRH